MANLITEEFHHLLVEKQQLIQNGVELVHDYPSLKAQTIQQELHDEIEALVKLLGEGLETFRQGFLDRCKQRAEQNANSCLSLFAMPDGECNQLYWHIAARLFEPKTMGDLLGILAPNITTLVSYEVASDANQGSLRERAKNPVFHFEERDLSSLNQEPSRAALGELAVSGNHLFEVTNLVQFDFATHEKFFDAFQQQYPELAATLYQHNEAFKTLQKNLVIVSKGRSPREVIQEFIQQLLLGGETLTGETYASLEAQKAVTDFFGYLESLPDSLKQALLGLKTKKSFSLNDVCEHLRNENCVEQAASYLKDILNNEANTVKLDTRPHLSPEQLQAIQRPYGRIYPLPAASTNTTTTLPIHYLEESLNQLVIDDEQAYLNLILAFPPSYYSLLFKHAQITCEPALPEELGEMIENGFFNEEQLAALNQAIVDNSERLGGLSECLQFALYNNYELIKLILTPLPSNERLAPFKIKYRKDETFLHFLTEEPEALRTVLPLLPESERLALVNEKDATGNSTLHLAANNPEAIKAILTSLPESDRLVAVSTKNSKHNSTLHLAANNPGALKAILDSLPESDRLAAINIKNSDGERILHCAADNSEALKVILTSLPESVRLTAVKKKNGEGNSSLHYVIDKREALETILTLLPEDQRWEAVKQRNSNNASLLHRLVYYKKNALGVVFGLLHESHRLAAIQEKNRAGNSLLQRLFSQPETIIMLLTLLPKADRFAAVTEKDDRGNTLLHRVEVQTLASLLALLPETERLAALTIQNKRGNSVLHTMPIDNWAAMAAVLTVVPEDKRLAALRDRDHEGERSLLLRIADEPKILQAVLTLLPETDRLTALLEEDSEDNKILYEFADNSESLQAILALLPPPDYEIAVREIDYYKQTTLFNFLQEKRRLLKDIGVAHDYPSLKAQTIQQELHDEIEALVKLLGEGLETFRQGFLDRCKQRAEQNAGTCLSLFAMPDGECNQLYWHIAERLFEPKTMGDLLGILAPNITTLISYEVASDANQGSLRERAKNLVFHFEERNLSSLKQEPARAALSELAVSGNQLFEVTNLVQFDFVTHEKFFDAFQQQYPELTATLYQHNEAFKTLQKNLVVVRKGQSPREVIQEFIQQLLLGGETLTGEIEASLEAQKAVTDFFGYLESLPNAIKGALLLLETQSGTSLTGVCEHLRNETCVELAASYLKDILKNEANAVTLDTRPHLSPEQLQAIQRLYGRARPLPAASTNTTTTLPIHYLEEGLKQLVIDDEQAYLNLLLALSPSYYTLFLKQVQTSCDPDLPGELGEMMRSGLFNREQFTALNQAIVDNRERFGGFAENLRFALNYSNYELLGLVLTSLSPEERLAQFKVTYDGDDGYKYTLLHMMSGKPEALATALTLLPESDRLATINEEDSEGNSVLHLAVNNPDALKAILTSMPETARLKAINKKNSAGNSVLHVAINSPRALQTILDLLSPEEQTAVKEEELYKRMALVNLLQEKRALLQDLGIAHDYPSLRAEVIEQELHVQIESLLELLCYSKDLEAFRQVFLVRCNSRAEGNAGTCLSLFAMPDGECNQLYWQIAELLFKPKTMGDMLGILAPNVTTLVNYEVNSDASQDSLRERTRNPLFRFQEKSLACLEQTPSRAALRELAVSGSQLFEVANLIQFDFATHEKFFNAFKTQYPNLAEALYQHNDAFKTLQKNLVLVSKGQTPREVINEFIQQLLSGGETLTGEPFASIDTQKAVTDFFGYLESLPNTLKEALLELKTKEGVLFSLNNVCEHLRRENCVELAASYLKDILKNEANAATLDTRPHLSPEQLQATQRLYGRTRPLPAAGTNTTTTLPTYYLEDNLKHLVINDEQTYLNLLLAFPPSYYTLLFKHAQISCEPALPVELGYMIENGLFNSEQLTVLNQAIVDNRERLGGFFECLQFALNYSNYELAKFILTSLPPEQRVARLTEKDEVENTLLHAVAKLPEILTIALTLLPESERLAIINGKGSKGKSVLQLAAKNPDALKAILMSLPESDRLAAVNEKNGNGDSTLHLAAKNPDALKTILMSLPESDRLAAVNEKNSNGDSTLHLAAKNPKALETILTALPAIQRWDAVNEENGKHINLLRQIINKKDTLAMVFGLLHESHRLLANKVNNLLMGTIYSSETLTTLLALIPETERLAALKDDRGNIILPDLYARYSANWTNILPLLPNSDLLEFFTAKGGDYQNILERITTEEEFVTLLALLPEAVPLTSSAYSAKKNAQISLLYSHINQLRSYGGELYDHLIDKEAEKEGKKAIVLALNLNHFANKFIYAQNNEERQVAKMAFEKELRKGMLDMQHRALWKPILANIVLAATGLGLLMIVGKVCLTGSAFFMQTERHKQIDKIASNFTALQIEEETPLVSASI
ncbi:Ankyrin repeats (3 copies) [Legionella feeleii]|uniref:Ankyrin repeats (3 copies) n=3 Tax=Legionella feeleii TaxID=453 RepID=A0A0W0TL36_9GAMM|nr:hypothetical protein [Legionella feeleii]KTC96219.1 Ankyrin repeats (3 copies) [Legionella feeleii]SPX60998.1 Ankyrin repeats (3 copies) [Legionella feeleii]